MPPVSGAPGVSGPRRYRNRFWLRDTIARRFATTVLLGFAVMVILAALFVTFGGIWARPPLEKSGLLAEAADLIRVLDAAPNGVRPSLAAAAATNSFRLDLYQTPSAVSDLLRHALSLHSGVARKSSIAIDTPRNLVAFDAFDQDSPILNAPAFAEQRQHYPQGYFLAAELGDGTWLVFTVYNRTWGLNIPGRAAIGFVCLILSTLIVSAIMTRRLSRPIEQLAAAVRRFGINLHAPAMPETGPQEVRSVIAAFNAMHAQVQQFVAYRMTMLAAISHDLRTPLTRIRLRGEYLEDDEQRLKLFRDVDEMQAMIDGALSFFRDDADEEASTPFDLTGVLRTIANDYADQGINVPYDGPVHAVYFGRPFALKRAFSNLIDNAVRYATPPEIDLTSDGTGMTVRIRDGGTGIPVDSLDRVFAPFYRLEKSRNRSTGGVGLGLSTAQAIVRGHGGEIELKNRSEGGLDVLVHLPIVALSAREPSA